MAKYNIFYLHPCARASAGWLKDDDINTAWIMSYRTLCDAALMATLGDAGTILPGPHEIHKNPYVRWCLDSVWNYEWLYQYYLTLSDMNRDIFDVKPNHYRTNKELYDAKYLIPHNKFTPPGAETNQDGVSIFISYDNFNKLFSSYSYEDWMRKDYLEYVKASSYIKNPRPFWMPQVGRTGWAWRKSAVQKVSKQKSADEIPSGPGVDPRDPYGIMADTP